VIKKGGRFYLNLNTFFAAEINPWQISETFQLFFLFFSNI